MRKFLPAFSFNPNVICKINLPYLYRYEDSKYIDDFFINGNIFLSSFKIYRGYSDNELGDEFEGHVTSVVKGKNDLQLMVGSYSGESSYCFCTSTVLDEGLKSKFKRDSAFRIIDPLMFINRVNDAIDGLRNVLIGNCIYVKDRIIIQNNPLLDVESISEDFNEVAKVTHTGIDSYFLKKITHQEQSEFRIIWQTNREINSGIIINCKEATKCCERIN